MTRFTANQRLQELRRLLSSGRPVVAQKLAIQWGCNEKTVRRQLKKLQTADRLPVEYDRVKKQWHSDTAILAVDPILVSPEDRRALLFSLQATAQLEGVPVQGQVRRLYEQLLATLPPEQATQFEQMMALVRFTGPQMLPIRPQVWSTVLLCLEGHETMNMRYTSGQDGKDRNRDFDPYGMIMRDRHWNVIGYCHLMKYVIALAVHRIVEASGTDRLFLMPEGYMDKYLATAFDGLASTGKNTKVVLRIAKTAPRYVLDRVWNAQEKRRHDRKGNIVVTFHTTALFMVEREVRAEAGWVELIYPKKSRQELRNTGDAIGRLHR